MSEHLDQEYTFQRDFPHQAAEMRNARAMAQSGRGYRQHAAWADRSGERLATAGDVLLMLDVAPERTIAVECGPGCTCPGLIPVSAAPQPG